MPPTPTATRTVNPLPFEHLEHHRFEDLVRQLAYDFRPWRKLEATGRAGSESGFDARGWEVVTQSGPELGDSGREGEEAGKLSDEEEELVGVDRLWLIQCKREKTIGPTKVLAYLAEIPEAELRTLYGLLFVAPATFSRKSRDALTAKCREVGVQEVHVWGRGELEDLLFQPKNDHLLFAYFGISLQIRRRSERTELRSWLAMKRKAHRMLAHRTNILVVVRDPKDTDYPLPAEKANKRKGWRAREFTGFEHHGVTFRLASYYAYIADDGVHWDVAFGFDDTLKDKREDPWDGVEDAFEEGRPYRSAWLEIPDGNRAMFNVDGVVDYRDILDLDDLGDPHFEGSTLFATYKADGSGPYSTRSISLHLTAQQEGSPPSFEKDGRIKYFPQEMRVDPDGELWPLKRWATV